MRDGVPRLGNLAHMRILPRMGKITDDGNEGAAACPSGMPAAAAGGSRMRRAIMLIVLVGLLGGAAAWEVRPGRWAAEQLATQVAQQMAAGDVPSLIREASPALVPILSGHLAPAVAPLHGATVRNVRLVRCIGDAAEATVQYGDGRRADIQMTRAGGTRWLVSGLT